MHADALTRLKAVNPAIADPERGQDAVAQAALERILGTPALPPASTRRHALTPRGLVLVLAVLLVGVGGALAATDPMGWWSNNRSEAHYRVNPNTRVRTPSAQQIRCRPDGNRRFNCTAATTHCYQIGQEAPFCKLSGTGLAYSRIGTIHAPPRDSLLTRAGFTRAISKAVANGTMTAADAMRFRSDLARVPDSFFTELRLASRYGTYGTGGASRNGRTLVPPISQPATLVCAAVAGRISCQNLNGDPDTPVGAGVYSANPGPGWRWVKAPRYIGGLPPGVHFSRADYQVLIDMLRFGTTTHSGSASGHATTVPITHLQAPPARVTHRK